MMKGLNIFDYLPDKKEDKNEYYAYYLCSKHESINELKELSFNMVQ